MCSIIDIKSSADLFAWASLCLSWYSFCPCLFLSDVRNVRCVRAGTFIEATVGVGSVYTASFSVTSVICTNILEEVGPGSRREAVSPRLFYLQDLQKVSFIHSTDALLIQRSTCLCL